MTASPCLRRRWRHAGAVRQTPPGAIIHRIPRVVLVEDRKGESLTLRQDATNLIRVGILILPLAGLLALAGALGSYGEPEARTDIRAAAQAAASTGYFVSQLANIVSSTALIFGVMALAAYLANTRTRVVGSVAFLVNGPYR